LTPNALIEVQDDIQPIMSTPTRRRKVLLADDHHLILDALTTMMGGDFEVMAVDNSDAFIQSVASFEPDVAILDINMPGGNGIMTARRALELRPNLPIVFLSMYADPQYIDQAIQVGARAYLSKVAPAQELISAMHAVLEGETLITAPIKDEASSTSVGKSDLTMRQREVLRLIAMGSSAKDIANQLNISVRTAEFHRAAIMQRLGLHSTAQMTRYAIANNIA
jgi:DNA-binding NarL/FixJ family response regulator